MHHELSASLKRHVITVLSFLNAHKNKRIAQLNGYQCHDRLQLVIGPISLEMNSVKTISGSARIN